MPWRPLPRIAFGVAKCPYEPGGAADLPLELGDELYIIEEGGRDFAWFRGYLVAPPSLLSGLNTTKGQTLEARVFSGIFPRSCVEIRELLGDATGGRNRQRSRQASVVQTSLPDKARDAHRAAGGDPDKEARAKALAQLVSGNLSGAMARTGTVSMQAVPMSYISRNMRGSVSEGMRGGSVSEGDKPVAPVPMLKIGDEAPTSIDEPLVDEIASCLREWHSKNLHELLLSRDYSALDELSDLVNQLDTARRQLMHGVLTHQEREALREKTVWDLIRGNKMLHNDIVVRDPAQGGRLLLKTDSPIEISRLQAIMSLLDQPPKPFQDTVNLYHVLLEIKDAIYENTEKARLSFTLCSKTGDGPLTPIAENFMFDLPEKEQLTRLIEGGRLRTLVTDLTSADAGTAPGSDTKLYIVCKVQVNQVFKTPGAAGGGGGPPGGGRGGGPPGGGGGGGGGGPPGGAQAGRGGGAPGSNPSASSSKLNLLRKGGDSKSDGGTPTPPPGGAQKPLPTQPPGAGKTSPAPGQLKPTQTEPPSGGPPPKGPPGAPSGQGPKYIRRMLGAGILPLNNLLESEGEDSGVITIWSPADTPTAGEDMEGWDPLVEEILTSPSKAWTRYTNVSQLRLHLRSFHAPESENLIRTTPAVLHNIQVTPKIGFSGAPTAPRSDLYITITEPILPDGATIAHPERGNMELPHLTELRDLTLTMEVRKITGERIENCIFPSSNSPGQTAWRSSAIGRGERWNQNFKLAIPTEDVPVAHIIMSISVFTAFPFALAWIPLWSKGALLQDGVHYPILHIYDKSTSQSEGGRGGYLNLQWDYKTLEGKWPPQILSVMSTIKMDSYLCSTYFTQNPILLGILKWREQPDEQVQAYLSQLTFVPEIEIVKLVRDVFDALFGILTERAGNKDVEDIVFNALVYVLGIMNDRRFNLDPVVMEYAEQKFYYPSASESLLQSYLRLTTGPMDAQSSRQLRATLKVTNLIMKFIIIARKQQERSDVGTKFAKTSMSFYHEIEDLFTSFAKQMRVESAAQIGSKTLIVQHMHTWLPELAPCISMDDVFKIATNFIDACSHVQGKLVLHKLVMLWNVLQFALNTQSPSLPHFVDRVFRWLDPYWGRTDQVNEQIRDQVHLVCSVVALLDGDYGRNAFDVYVKIIYTYVSIEAADPPTDSNLTLLFPTSYPFQTKPIDQPKDFDENLIELAALKATFNRDALGELIDFSRNDLTDIMQTALHVNISILRNDAFPDTWLTLHMFYHRGVYEMLQGVKNFLTTSALPPPDEADRFNTELWKQFMLGLLTLMRSPCLALEEFPEQKRRAVWKICGDVRERGAALLTEAWNLLGWDADEEEKDKYGLEKLGGYQVQYVPGLVSEILELALSIHDGLRRSAVEVLQTMIISEWDLNDDLTVIHAEIIDCLDDLFRARAFGESAKQKLFVMELEELFLPLADTPDRDLWEAIQKLLASIDHMLELLFAVHAPEQNEAVRIMHTLRLMDFLKSVHKEQHFISYIHRLSSLEAGEKRIKEAGLALRMHADLYTWDHDKVVDALVDPIFPKQTAFDRREMLYFEMIKLFETAHAWEPALACYKELGEQYETSSFDLGKLARSQRSIAKVYEQIAKGDIDIPRYFRVTYRGMGFDVNLRDKSFIFESDGTERLAGFTERIQQQYPNAQIVHREDDELVEGQHVQISSVAARRDLQHPIWQRKRVPYTTKEYFASLNTNMFTITARRVADKSGAKQHLVEKTVFTTAETFPTILRRSEIVSQHAETLNPLETALERTLRKISELLILNQRINAGDQLSYENLQEALRSSVDPSSSSSVAQYREMAGAPDGPSGDDLVESKLQPLQRALQNALLDFAGYIRVSLEQLTGPSYRQEQAVLARQFQKMFAPELSVLSPQAAPLPTPPTRSQTRDFMSSARSIMSSDGLSKRRHSRLTGLMKRSTANQSQRGGAPPAMPVSGLGLGMLAEGIAMPSPPPSAGRSGHSRGPSNHDDGASPGHGDGDGRPAPPAKLMKRPTERNNGGHPEDDWPRAPGMLSPRSNDSTHSQQDGQAGIKGRLNALALRKAQTERL